MTSTAESGIHGKVNKYIRDWTGKGYSDGIPDECPKQLERLGLVPSYRMIATAILDNDIGLRSLGFTSKHSVWYDEIKRIETQGRKPDEPQQQRLF